MQGATLGTGGIQVGSTPGNGAAAAVRQLIPDAPNCNSIWLFLGPTKALLFTPAASN